ncbi:DEAD-box ATP-dependent RNA helicase 25 [Choanephora cucurbitarum]|uniref:ATP-dependent RNA helicase n=1 Tax=Choanephora cucurbitarum TaxID=101091 RepID=A0A1C7N157_9FUNG|nr:DEAD-box ATP-dependent RNA helicase 25 [Choanephora cucurbitarum]
MLRKLLIPSTLRLGRASALSRGLTGSPLIRPTLLSQSRIQPTLLNTKISPYALFHTQVARQSVSVAELDQEKAEEEVKKMRFDAIEAIHPNTQRALQKVFNYQEMSSVQEAVLTRLPNKSDMFVKAKTGTGKTLAFLVAALETALMKENGERQSIKDFRHFDGTSIMVISPTRELANQIADEATKLTSFYPFKVHCLVGGDSKRRQILKMERSRCDIVVATPGRLQDMLSSVPRFKKMCENLKCLVLDEADQLLDMGFKAELQRILKQIPEQRQTMLFSATISDEIRENLGQFALSPSYDLIDTVGENDVNTNLHVKQSALVAPYHEQLALLRTTLETHEAAQKGKVIVFLPTTKSTIAYAHIFKSLLPNKQIYEIHSKKNQDQRSRIADRFRKSRDSSILFTSDVSARGVDYPGVSLVFQVGVPSSREQYIHRLGRTGRAGREGEGIIMLAPFEETFLTKEISDLPIQQIEPVKPTEEELKKTTGKVFDALAEMDMDIVRELYTAYLGYYSGQLPTLGQRRSIAVKEANKFLQSFGVQEPPHLSQKFLSQLGLNESSRNNRDDRFNRRGSFRDFDHSRRRDTFRPRDGDDFKSRRGSFRSRDDDFKPRDSFRSRDDSFRSRNDSFKSRDDFKPREGSFRSRNDFKSREGGFRSRDDFKSRDDSFKNRQSGFRDRRSSNNEDFSFEPKRRFD